MEVPHFDYLNLSGLRTAAPPDEEEFSIWVTAEQFPKLQSCSNCGYEGKEFILNGTRSQTVRDVPRGLKSLYVEVLRQSYRCKQCLKSVQHPLLIVNDKWLMTSRLVSYIEKMALLRPARQVALMTGASSKTIREILIEHIKHMDATVHFETPRVLGIDGVFARVKDKNGKSRKKECAIMTNIEAGLVIDLHPDITIDAVRGRLRKLTHPERVKVVLVDMSTALIGAIRKELPHALIVIDLFHIQSKINEGLDNVRKRLRKGSTRRKGQLIMCRRELLRKRRRQLKPNELKELEMWFEYKPELRQAYEVVEGCLKIWASSSSRMARERYRDWLTKFPLELRADFAELLSALGNWGEYIFNYFDERFTNAFTESSNRLVKDIQRETRSCDFNILRGRVIYGTLLKQQMEKARREEMKRKKRKPQQERARKRRRKSPRATVVEAHSAPLLGNIMTPSFALQMDLFQSG
jgi:transposase